MTTVALMLACVVISAGALWLVRKSRYFRLRNAARRLQTRAGAAGFHLPSDNGLVTDVALITKRDDDASALAARGEELLSMYLEELSKESLAPSPEYRALQVHVVSREQIRRGGGALHFWRDYGLF